MKWQISTWFDADRTNEKAEIVAFLNSDKASNGKKWWINQAFQGDIDKYMEFMYKSNKREEYVLERLKLLNPGANVYFLDDERDYICTNDPSHGKPDIQFNDKTIEVKPYKICVDDTGHYIFTEASTNNWDDIWKWKFHDADFVIDIDNAKQMILCKNCRYEIFGEHVKGTHREWWVKIYDEIIQR